MAGKKKKEILAKKFDLLASEGGDISEYLELDKVTQRVNIDFPLWVIKSLDSEAARQGLSRQAIIKSWIVAKLDELISKQSQRA